MRIDEFHARQCRIPVGEEHDALTEAVIGAMIEVHCVLGPGFSESVYEEALCRELEIRGIRFQRQVPVVIEYKGAKVGEGRIDLIVESRLIVELKTCDALGPIHRAQCITYLCATRLKVALLANFNVPILKDGIKRVVRTE